MPTPSEDIELDSKAPEDKSPEPAGMVVIAVPELKIGNPSAPTSASVADEDDWHHVKKRACATLANVPVDKWHSIYHRMPRFFIADVTSPNVTLTPPPLLSPITHPHSPPYHSLPCPVAREAYAAVQ